MMIPLVALSEPLPQTHLALCKVSLAGSTPPEWIELVPAGAEVPAVDGRKFRNPNPQRIVETFRAYHLDLPIDYEHSSEIKGPKGEESPAAGWITDLEVREGSVWGKVDWTPKGTASLTTREYRYISPAFLHQKDGTIFQLVSAGLTNKPAMTQLAAVAHVQEDRLQAPASKLHQETPMEPELLKMLGLDEKASKDQVIAAVKAAQDKGSKSEGELAVARVELAKAQTPDLTKFVPRADYEVALARASAAEKSIAEEKAAALKATVDSEIDAALKMGKITPATVEFYRATCSQAGGLEKFREFVKAAPVIGAPSGLGEKKVEDKGEVADEAELAIARNCGLTDEQYLAAKKAQKK